MEKGTKLGSEIDGQTILVPSIFHLTLQVGDERSLEIVYPSRSFTMQRQRSKVLRTSSNHSRNLNFDLKV